MEEVRWVVGKYLHNGPAIEQVRVRLTAKRMTLIEPSDKALELVRWCKQFSVNDPRFHQSAEEARQAIFSMLHEHVSSMEKELLVAKQRLREWTTK